MKKVGISRSLVIIVTKGKVEIERGLYRIAVPHAVFIKEGINVRRLMYPQFTVGKVALELHAQECLYRSKVLDPESLTYLGLDECEERQMVTARQTIVDMDGEETVNEVARPDTMEDIQSVIKFRAHEPKSLKDLA
jgi:hypothetical protein